jgi:hypothetical protein
MEIGVDVLTRMWDPKSLEYLYRFPKLGQAVDELIGNLEGTPVPVALMVNRLTPGTEIETHVDKAPTRGVSRWHLPLITSRGALYWDEEHGWMHFEPGYWWGPIPFEKPHQVKILEKMKEFI